MTATKKAIRTISDGTSLTEEQMTQVMTEIMKGQATPAQIGGFLTALRMKGETVDEISGAARVMRQMAIQVRAPRAVIDTCGTGGDGCRTFNISTATAFVVAAAGLCVAKHGNRAMSGTVGGADVLETLGARIELSPAHVERCMREVGFGFLLAPGYHRAMQYAVGPRREIGIRTIFNLLGPLTNPAGAAYQLLGVFDGRWLQPLAHALGRLGSRHALVVHGVDGLDEVSLGGETRVAEWCRGGVSSFSIHPRDFGFAVCRLDELQVGSPRESAEIIRAIFSGRHGPPRDIVLLNAGAALYAGEAVASISDGIDGARQALDSGTVNRLLDRFITLSQREDA